MPVKIIDRLPEFVKKNDAGMDRALNRMAVDIERDAKMTVPHDTGRLAGTGLHKKLGNLKWVVAFDTVYARYQEFGGDGRRIVRNYSKPGKKAHYLRDAGNLIAGKALNYFKAEAPL